ncbi:MAG TPA: response regulator [Edaphobacter sp.]|nr:response regulator [Edaphobacter sp.]
MTPTTRLFIVDDETRILTSIADLFEDEFEILTSVDASSALKYIEQNEVAVVLSDERMPNMTGHEFLGKVKQVSKATRVLLTGYADIEAITQALNKAEIYAYLTKPWDPQELRSTLLRAADRYRLEATIDEERALLHALMETIPDPIYFKDVFFRFSKINRAKARLLGAGGPDECRGKIDKDFPSAGYASHAPEDERRVIQLGVIVADRIEEMRGEQGARWQSTTTAPVVDRLGVITGLVGITRDVTNLKRTEQELVQKNENLQNTQLLLAEKATALAHSERALQHQNGVLKSILDSMGDAVVVSDTNGRVMLSNPAAQRLFGLRSTELSLGEKEAPTCQPESGLDRLRKVAPLANAPLGGSADGTELLFEDAPGGRPIWLSITARPLREENGNLRGGVVVCREITSRKEVEEGLRLATKTAEHANRAKSEFLSTMSHEIRTPMNAILAMADLLFDTPLNAQQKEYVGVFQRTGGSLLTLVDQVLDLSKIEAGHLELEAIEFDLASMVRQRVDVMRNSAQRHGIELTAEIEPDVPGKLLGDPNRVGQVLFNLLANALKFTEKGKVSLVVDRVSGVDDHVRLRFRVTDTGIGIPAQRLALIFAPFTQMDASTTRQYGGTGLGLTISRALVELMGGQIEVESKVGTGSTFFCTVPFTLAPRPVDSTAGSEQPVVKANLTQELESLGRREIRVLLADDNDDNIYVIRAYLRQPGLVLDVAKNGQEALDTFKRGHYDVVLMDIEMPVMDGYAATRAIRQWERVEGRSSTPVLALTAYALKGEVQKTITAGCTEHLTKPVKRSVLVDAIYQHSLQVERGAVAVPQAAQTVGVDDEMNVLKPAYLQGIRANIEAILAAVDQEDYVVARKLGHQMAGSGGAYGFPEITKLGKALEKAGSEESGDAIRGHLKALAHYVGTDEGGAGAVELPISSDLAEL